MGELLALLTALLWAIGVICFKRAMSSVTPFGLNLYKNCVAIVLLGLTAIMLGQTRVPTSMRDLLVIAASGAIGIGISDTLFLMALSKLGASRTALVDCLYSPFVIFFSTLILGETLSLFAGIGGLLIVGSVVMSSQQGFEGSIGKSQLYAGAALGTAAMATVAFAAVIVKPLLSIYPLFWLSCVRMTAGIGVLLVALPLHPDRKTVRVVFRSQPSWTWMLAGSFFGSYLSLVCWLAGFKYAQAGIAALLNQTSTVLIVLFAAILLKEPLTSRKMFAVAMAFIGAVLVFV